MSVCIHNPKYRPVLEFMAGLVAQGLVLGVAFLWFASCLEGPALDTGRLGVMASCLGAVVFIGPQVAFLLRRGDTVDRLMAAAQYIAFGFVALVACAVVCGGVVALCFPNL